MVNSKIPSFHFTSSNYELLEYMKKNFSNCKNVTIDQANINDINRENKMFVSLTSSIIGQPTCVDKLFLTTFKHDNILNSHINKLTKYTSMKVPYLSYDSIITIDLGITKILYIPIRFSIESNIPTSHIHNAISTIFGELEKYDTSMINEVIIPLDGIENYLYYNIRSDIIAGLIYDSYKYNSSKKN